MQHIMTASWLPHDFVGRAQRLDFDSFVEAFGCQDFLIVNHGIHASVRGGLEQAIPSAAAFPVTPLASSMPAAALITQVDELMDEPPQVGMRSTDQIARRLADWAVFVLPLQKRLDNGFPAKIAVGRTPNNDILLRHPTVSQFHAWFHRDDEGRLFLRDAESKNGSLHNGAPLLGPVRVVSGDILRFGRVETMSCSAEVLWALASRETHRPPGASGP